MASTILSRSLRPSATPSTGLSFVCASCRRHKATAARARKALRIKPDAAFAPSKTEKTDHIIFNPPSSAPDVYQTPQKFLPPSDPRRKLHSLAQSSVAAGDFSGSQARPTRLPPPVRPPYEKKYHLGKEEIEEIRKLRAEDPRLWTRVRLAEKFECSQFFVGLCCCAPEIKEERDQQLEEIKKRWGRKKTEAREDRQIRKELWGRDG